MRRIQVSIAPVIAAALLAFTAAAPATYALRGSAPGAIAVWVSGPAPMPAPGLFEMSNVHRTFSPGFIIVPAGSRVRFANEDPFFHSIYSTNPKDPFDVGYEDTGPGRYVSLAHPAVVEVRCHIHTYMHGLIVVTGGPYSEVRGNSFEISGLPKGRYTVHEILADGTDKTSTVDLTEKTAPLNL